MISNRLPPTIKSKEEEDDEQLSSLILEPKRVRSILKTLLTNTEIHRNLWHLSFVDCSLNEDILLPLSQFASMGLLDFSFTNIDVLTLQRIIRPIRCLRLHLFQCQQLKISSADDKLYGFVLFSLPGVWSLNGILTLTEDRNKWTHYYLHGKGKFSDLIRKGQFVKFDSTPSPVGKIVTGKPLMSKGAGSPAGVPFILNKSLGRNNTRSNDGTSTTSNSNSRSGGEIRVGWIWNKWSYSLLSRMPVGFRMGGEESTWKLGKLCAELDRAVQQSLKVSSPSTSLISLNNIISLSSEVKIVLSHLVWASLLSDFPMILLQKSLEFILLGSSTSLSSTATTTDNLNWLKHPTSPLLWPRNLRMLFLTIMMASMKMDMSAGKKRRF